MQTFLWTHPAERQGCTVVVADSLEDAMNQAWAEAVDQHGWEPALATSTFSPFYVRRVVDGRPIYLSKDDDL